MKSNFSLLIISKDYTVQSNLLKLFVKSIKTMSLLCKSYYHIIYFTDRIYSHPSCQCDACSDFPKGNATMVFTANF